MTAIHQFVRVGCHAIVGGCSRITQDVAPYVRASGSPPRNAGINTIGLERRGFSRETREALAAAYRILFREQRTVFDAVSRIRESLATFPRSSTWRASPRPRPAA